MERTQLFDLMGELKLYGMKDAFDDVNGTLNLTRVCRYRHFEADPSASSLCPRSREQCGQMFSSLSFALLGRAMMPARRLSLSL